jgi:hypothetical protein
MGGRCCQREAGRDSHGIGTTDELGTTRKEDSRQMVIDVSGVREDVVDKVATTEAAREAIQ